MRYTNSYYVALQRVKVSMGTVEKLILENLDIDFGILSLGLYAADSMRYACRDNYPPPFTGNMYFKSTIATLGLR